MDRKTLIRLRADLYRQVRSYFQEQSVLEVETPVLGRSGPTDLHLASMSLPSGSSQYYLQTSPEFFMKRLLAENSGDIFSISRCFRDAEVGHRHNPEFSMLEWYRCGFGLADLMSDVEALVSRLLPHLTFSCHSYAEMFESCLGVNPHSASDMDLLNLVKSNTKFQGDLGRASCLDLLMSECVEPELAGQEKAHFLFDFPMCQAAMAQTGQNEDMHPVARRFELYINGLEIGNGYLELTSADEQRRRFQEDNIARHSAGFESMPIDENFLKALDQMPDCSGVAIGLDRLLWLIAREKNLVKSSQVKLGEVLLFPWCSL